MNNLRSLFLVVFLVVLSGCAGTPNHQAKSEREVKVEKSNDLTVRDVIVAVLLKAPRPKLGETKSKVFSSLKNSSGEVIHDDEQTITANFHTEGTPIETAYSHCELKYSFDSGQLVRGPIVVGDCSNLEIKGKRNPENK
ncbi:hypothetical protein [Gallaecimonas mangrovi]|uniref:hypothetical protein n=1 Tax=Gallaecimonas mangrovi TaxID=2291597 RepID=UPI000E200C8E|nr:hypothetical protein [Gallaecimonas mangrovi]